MTNQENHINTIPDTQEFIDYMDCLIKKNGPEEKDYPQLNAMNKKINQLWQEGTLNKSDINELKKIYGDVYSTPKTLFGFVNTRPHGYPGDFEIIDKIYTKYISPNEKYKNWDKHIQSLDATEAVRNRKTYFKNILRKLNTQNTNAKILNLASGPCRDLSEFFIENSNSNLQFHCVEMDENAIAFAKELLNDNPKVHFIQKNIFRFHSPEKYDLVWSAGLFDYFDDKTFVAILSRIKENVSPNGEIIIGNFHPSNTSRPIMEFGRWFLHHRTEMQLMELAAQAGFLDKIITIEKESLGVNLFMRIKF